MLRLFPADVSSGGVEAFEETIGSTRVGDSKSRNAPSFVERSGVPEIVKLKESTKTKGAGMNIT